MIDPLAGLNAAQRRAAEAVRGPVCILAGAGTGKTRTITHRIAQQIAVAAAQPHEVLAVTFTDRAAGELRARLRQLGVPPVRAATFHAAAWAQLRYFWDRLDRGGLPDVLDSKAPLLAAPARRLGLEIRDLAAEIEWAKARCHGPDEYADSDREAPADRAAVAAAYDRYEQEKLQRNLIDYEDMLLLTARLLGDDADAAATVRARYRVFTVDEFQDVNPAQWALLRAWLGDRDELCVVGDDDQTIYSFTGATSEYLTTFRARYPDATVVALTDNYRSTAQILGVANRTLWTKPAHLRRHLRAQTAVGAAPCFRELPDAAGEIDAVIADIRQRIADGTPPGEIAICYRTNSQSEAFESALEAAGVPFTVHGDVGFFDRAEIRQALAVLGRAAARPAAPLPPGPAGAVPARPPRPDRAVEEVLREQLGWHPRREPTGEAALERWRNISALRALAGELADQDPNLDVPGLVAALTHRAQDHGGAGGDAVVLLTLHRAKGLEFDAVYVVAVEEGYLPIVHAKSDEQVAEERRLLYVGITRARRHLWLSWSTTRPGLSGRPRRRRPSRFLYGLGPGAPQARGGQTPGGQAKKAAPTVTTRDPAEQALADRLRSWRLERATRDGVPAFVVFADRTLDALVDHRPSNAAELLAVPGFGPVKVDRYGTELLAVLAMTRR